MRKCTHQLYFGLLTSSFVQFSFSLSLVHKHPILTSTKLWSDLPKLKTKRLP